MKKFLVLLLIPLLYGCEDNEDNPYVPPLYHDITDTYVVNCPEPPIEIMSNIDEESVRRDEKMLNGFKILQMSENLYYMYYEAFKEGKNDGEQGLYFAYSNDCKNWIKRIPNSPNNDNTIFSSNFVGIDVVKVPDTDYPYRMFASKLIVNDEMGLYMLKSKDGIKFENEKVIFMGMYDTQNAALVKGDSIKLYFRVWHNNYNRKIGYTYLDLDGNILDTPYVLEGRNLYYSAASHLNSDYDILFPTYFVTLPTNDDIAEIEVLIAKEFNSKKIKCNISRWINTDELWAMVSPGILTINNEKYIAYNTKNWLHDVPMPEGGISKYKLIKIQIDNN